MFNMYSRESIQLLKDFVKGIRVHPAHKSGHGRYRKIYVYKPWKYETYRKGGFLYIEVPILKHFGLIEGQDYYIGNDAPRGGQHGYFVQSMETEKVKELKKKLEAYYGNV